MSSSIAQQPLIQVVDLSWQVKDKMILQQLSFTVNKGQILGVIGPNGAGKTSLLRCLLNQQNDFSGDVYFKNKKLCHYNAQQIAKSFAVVTQKATPIFALSVFDVVRMGLLPHKGLFSLDNDYDRHQIELALEKVGLMSSINSTYHLLSGGEQQRVLIARALVQKAEILILDEPTNHLDVYYQHQILQLVNSLGITVIMTVHDLNLAAQYCDRLLLLNQGKLICNDVPKRVLTSQVLTDVFGLYCHQDLDPITQSPRVSFYLKDPLITKKDMSLVK
jgi:iron complex transport system ATP-binding protein|tara:strand:+ start:295 stop:1122 length:828 start_codon:yes stop_codon:yes gene_type:complete